MLRSYVPCPNVVLAAVNEASRKVDEAVQGKIGGMAGGLPGLFR